MKMRMNGLISATCMACLAAFGGQTYYWNGSQVVQNYPQTPYVNINCAFWTNAANWTVDGATALTPPGQYYDVDGVLVGDPNCTVVFGALEGGCSANVNTQGKPTASNIVFTADAPSYLVCISLDQGKETLRPYSNHGRITVEAGSAAQTIRLLACNSELGTSNGATWNADPKYPLIVNNSANPLTLMRFGMLGFTFTSSWPGGEYPVGFGGSGEIIIDAMSSRYHTLRYMLHGTNGSKLSFNSSVTDWPRLVSSHGDNVTREICFNENCVFKLSNPYGGFDVGGSGNVLNVTGGGTLRMQQCGKNNATLISSAPHLVENGARLNISCKVDGNDANAGFYVHYGSGVIDLTATNTFSGYLDLLASDLTLRTASIGAAGEDGPLGRGTVRFCNYSRLLYVGGGETCTRPLTLHNYTYGIYNEKDYAATPAGVVEQGGTGTLVVNSPVTVDGEAAGTLVLANATAQNAEWRAALPAGIGIRKTGSGRWILSAANAYTGPTTVRAGTLVLANAAALGATSGVVADTGAATIEVADGVAIPATPLSQSGAGALDIVLGEGASFKASGLAAGAAPTWLTVGGKSASVAADGTVTASETHWAAAVDGSWNVAANWDNGLPDAGRDAVIDRTGNYTVSLNEDAGSVPLIDLQAGTLAVAAPVRVTKQVEVGEGATFAMSAGNLALVADAKNGQAFHLDGGSASFFGGTVNITNFTGFTGGGTLAFSGTAKVLTKAGEGEDINFIADAGKTLDVSFTGSAYGYAGNASGAFNLGGTAGGRTLMTITRQDQFAGGTQNVGMQMNVGYGDGYSELLCNHNFGYIGAGNHGVSIGRGKAVDWTVAPTGVLTVAGSKLTVGGVGFWWTGHWGGLSVGNGLDVKDGYGSKVVGRATVKSQIPNTKGSLSVSGQCGIGIGRGEGTLLVTGASAALGGVFSYNGSSSWNSMTRVSPMVLGYAGGDGTFIISNGTATVNNSTIFVGGCSAADINRYTAVPTTYVQAGGKNSRGLLAVRGGTFTQMSNAAGGIILGADGEGRLEIGPDGVLATPSIVVSNQVSGTLAFELGADARVGRLEVTNLVLSAGAKIVVDARKLARRPASLTKLATVGGEVVGTVRAEDLIVETTPEYAKLFNRAEIVYAHGDEKGLWLQRPPTGVVLMFR